MVANEKPKQKNTGLNLAKLVLKEKESDDNIESASSKDKVVSRDDNSTQNVVFQPDIEDKPNIDFYNTPKVPNDEDEPIIDFDDTPKLCDSNK